MDRIGPPLCGGPGGGGEWNAVQWAIEHKFDTYNNVHQNVHEMVHDRAVETEKKRGNGMGHN